MNRLVFLLPILFSSMLFGNVGNGKVYKVGAIENKLAVDIVSPSIFWVSDPVLPGEVVLVEGANFGKSPKVELCWLKDDESQSANSGALPAIRAKLVIEPIESDSCTVKFLVPREWDKGMYLLRIGTEKGWSEPERINKPDIWWKQGDQGKIATRGGWLRIFGKCLSINGKAKIRLTGETGIELSNLVAQDLWSLKAELPASLTPGDYEIWVNNGSGGDAGWKNSGKVAITDPMHYWKEKVFDVTDFGARANDEFDDTNSIQSALNAAGENGGGIVQVPRGKFQINNTLLIPRGVLLRGENRDLTMLYWRDRTKPLESLIQGSNTFGLEDLTLQAINHEYGIVSDLPEKKDAGNVFLTRLCLQFNMFDQLGQEGKDVIKRMFTGNYAVRAGGENVQIRDCRIYTSNQYVQLKGHHCLISNNTFEGGGTNNIVGSENTIENNIVTGGPVTRGGVYGALDNTYFARNEMGNVFLHDAEIITTDGGWHQPVKLIEGSKTHYTIDKDLNPKLFVNPVILVHRGKGAGQYRNVVSYEGRKIELEKQWQVEPDASSEIVIFPPCRNTLLIGNEFHDGPIVQNFTRGINWIFSGNKFIRTGGANSAGRGLIPNWHPQYLENEIIVGNYHRGHWGGHPADDAHLEIIGAGARGGIFRKNILHNNSRIDITQNVQNVLIENNTIRNADAGIQVSPSSKGVFLWNNHFDKVKNPLPGTTHNYFIHPAEWLLCRMNSEGIFPENVTRSAEWQSLLKELAGEKEKTVISNELKEKIKSIQLQLIQVSSRLFQGGITFSALQALTGLSISERSSEDLIGKLRNASGGRAETQLSVSVPEWSASCSVTLELPEGWTESSSKIDFKNITAGKSAGKKINVSLPKGVWGKSWIPMKVSLAGENWKLQAYTKIQLGNGSSVSPDYISEWMVAGPFLSDLPGQIGGKVYPPEKNIHLTSGPKSENGKSEWKPVQLKSDNNIDFTQLFGNVDKGVAFALSVIRVTNPVTVSITTNGGSPGLSAITYLDNEVIGIPYRSGSIKVSRHLGTGDHLLMVGVANNGKSWKSDVQLNVDSAATPGDVMILACQDLYKSETLSHSTANLAESGFNLPFSDGFDWKLVFEDNFNREKFGDDWIKYEPRDWYESNSWYLDQGQLTSRGKSYFEYITCNMELTPPIRIECDIIGYPDRSTDWFQAFTLTPGNQVGDRRLWGAVNGAGYMVAIGWNRNPNSTALWRAEKEIFTNLKSPILESNKKRHVIVQFTKNRILLIVDGVVSIDYKEANWIEGLNTVSLMNGFGRDRFDNLKIYTSKKL